MRLLFATSYGHLPDVIGGLQTTLHELSLALVHRDVEVHILCGFDGADDASSRFARSDSTLGYTVARLPDPVTALPAVCAACNPDAIVVQTSSPTIPMLLAALDTRIPTLLYIHNVEYRDLGGILLPDPSIRYLANSAFTAERIDATFGFKPHVLPPLVQGDHYRIDSARKSVLFINPSVIKGIEIFFRVAERLPERDFRVAESWRLNKAWRDYVQKRAAALGNVNWMPHTRNFQDLYGDARMLLMPSLWEETYGRSAIEAQLSALPVIATRRGGLPETIGTGGLLLDAHAPTTDWCDAVDSLYTDEALYRRLSAAALGNAAREEIQPEILVDRLLQHVQSHINNVLG